MFGWHPYTKRKNWTQTHTKGNTPREAWHRSWRAGVPGPPEAGRGQEGFCPRGSGGSMALPTTWFGLLAPEL